MTQSDRTEEARQKLRAAALATPYFFGKLVCGFSDLRPDLHGAMSEWMLRKSPRKLGIVPRGFLKSSLWTIANNLRIATKYRHERILIVNETIGLPSTWIRMMQAIILSDIYRWLFPERVPDPEKVRWNATEIELAGRIPHPQPTIQAIGVGGASTGMHPTRVHEDDLVGKEASESQLVMQKAIDQHKLAESLIERPENPICTVGTRWGVYDLVRWMLENEPKLDFFKLAWRGRDGNPLWPERFPREVMDSIRRKYGAALFCTPAESPVLMADLSWRPISEVQVGEYVVGWNYQKDRRARLKPARVIAKSEGFGRVYRYTLESGRYVRCTQDHRWYRGNKEERETYRPIGRIGRSRLHFVLDPRMSVNFDPRAADWLAGFFDGEGTCTNQGLLAFSQSEKINPVVCRRLESVLDTLGFDYTRWTRKKHGTNIYYLNGGAAVLQRFLRIVRPTKWRERILDQFWKRAANFVKMKDRVVAAADEGDETVYGLQTETGNYVVWGYASSNSLQYENEAIAIGVTELRTEWLRFYHFGKDKDGETLLVLERRPEEGGDKSFRLKDCSRFMTIDPALSPESDAARSAFVTAALTPEVPYSIVLLGAVAKRVGPQHFVTEAYEQYKVWDATIAGIEVVAAQRSFYHWAIQQHPDFALRPLKTDSHKSKQTRIREFVPFYEQNRVYVQREQIDFLEEYESFPGGRTVDLLDATAYLPQIWFPPDGGAEVAEEEEEEEFEAYPTGRSPVTGY